MANVIIPTSGIAIPEGRVDYYRWVAQAMQTYKVEIGAADGDPFRLHDHQIISFQLLVNRIGSTESFIMDRQEFITRHNMEPFMQSNLYTSLSTRTTERISEILRRIIKARRRIHDADQEADRLQQILGNSPENAMNVGAAQAERLKRQRQLNARLKELKTFTDAKSMALTEVISIDEIRATEWWTTDVDEFFEQLVEETFAVKDEKLIKPEPQNIQGEVPQQAAE